jgi:hypothetical protein
MLDLELASSALELEAAFKKNLKGLGNVIDPQSAGSTPDRYDLVHPVVSVPTLQIFADVAAGAVVGAVNASGADAGGTPTYAVSDDRFRIFDGQLALKAGVSIDH